MDLLVCVLWFFLFQAEDGIRDLVRSRGLGDVYKRQLQLSLMVGSHPRRNAVELELDDFGQHIVVQGVVPVSYTHLTLPTSDLV